MRKDEQIITVIGQAVFVSDIKDANNGWRYQQVVVKQLHSKYPNLIAFTLWDDLCSTVKEGNKVLAYLSLEAKMNLTKDWFNTSVKAYKIKHLPNE